MNVSLGTPREDGSTPQNEGADRTDSRSVSTVRRLVWGLLAGAFIGLLIALLVIRWRNADPTPPLMPADFYAAREKWNSLAPPNYNIEVQVTGSQPAKYRVEVRAGEPIAAYRNDIPLRQQRTFSTWSVPGMFGTMSRDVENFERHAAGKADENTPRLTLRALFDPHYGFPQRYRRIQWGSDVEVAWNVEKFEVLPGAPANP